MDLEDIAGRVAAKIDDWRKDESSWYLGEYEVRPTVNPSKNDHRWMVWKNGELYIKNPNARFMYGKVAGFKTAPDAKKYVEGLIGK